MKLSEIQPNAIQITIEYLQQRFPNHQFYANPDDNITFTWDSQNPKTPMSLNGLQLGYTAQALEWHNRGRTPI